MANTISELKSLAIKGFEECWPSIPLLAFELSPQWASQKENYKAVIREALKVQIADLNLNPRGLKLDSQPPQHPEVSISFSHNPKLGGFILTDKSMSIGLDVEIQERITAKVLARTCEQFEIEQAPKPECLWVAKESTFKALVNDNQPPTITQIRISDWLKVNENTYLFKASRLISNQKTQKIKGSGFIIDFSPYLLSFFVLPAST